MTLLVLLSFLHRVPVYSLLKRFSFTASHLKVIRMLGCCLQANDPWKVRILPRVAFGVHPAGIDGLTPDAREIVVLHHFLGSWKKRGGWHKRRSVLQILAGAVSTALRRCALRPCCTSNASPAQC